MKSIFSKLGLVITSVVLLILLLIWIFQVVFLNWFYINERKNNLIIEGKNISDIILQAKDQEAIAEEINSFSSSYSAKIFYIDRQRNVLYPTTELPRTKKFLDQLIDDRDILRILEGNTVVFQHDDTWLGMKLLVVGIPVQAHRQTNGGVILYVPLAPIHEAVNILRKQLTIITIASLMIATMLSFLLARKFTNPILTITQAAGEIAKGNFNTHVSVNSEDEIGVLADSINHLAEQLGQIEKFRKDFIANVSHELKTPISLIKAYANMIRDINGDDREERENNLQIIDDETDRLNKMVEDILFLSQMEAGYYQPQLKKVFVYEVAQRIARKLAYLAQKQNTEVLLDCDDQDVTFLADEDKVEQVFFNLVHNALVHCGDYGKVIISIYCSNNIVHVAVKDNGEGIPKEDLPYIWDRFYKVDKSRKRDNSGTGLGLSIIKNILEAHHFEYGIESECGKGTMVWFKAQLLT